MNLELDQFRDVDLVIDRANDSFVQKQFVSQGDYKGRTLTVQVTNNGSVGEVPGLTLNLNWHNEASGLTDLTAFSVVNKAASVFTIEYPEHMMTPGKVYASIQIIQDGKVTNLKQFELTVQRLAGQAVGIVDKAEFSALVAVLADANKFRTDIDALNINKVTKGENESVTSPMLAKSLLEDLKGGSIDVNVNTSMIEDDAVSYQKLQKLGQNFDVIYTTGLPNVDTTQKTLVIPIGTYYLFGKSRKDTKSEISLSLTGANNYIYFNFTTEVFSVVTSLSSLTNVTKDDMLIGIVSFLNASSNTIRNIFFKGDYQVNGVLSSRVSADYLWDGTRNIAEGTIEYTKNQKLGSNVDLIFTNGLVNIDMTSKKIQIPREVYFLFGRQSVYTTEAVEIDLTSTHTYIYFNYSTKEFKKYTTVSSLNGVSKDEILFAVVSFVSSSLSDLRSVYIKGDYQVNGELASSRFTPINNTGFQKNNFSEPIPNGWYEPIAEIQGYEASSHYTDNITQDDIYQVYDDIVSNNPSWATKKLLGNDSSNTYPIFSYEFKPQDVETTRFGKKFPKIILVTNTHGEEKSSTVSLRNFIYDVSKNWDKNELLEYVRFNVHLIIVPILNPYGFVNFQRKNSNGIDINRNSSYRWETGGSTDPTATTYKGTEAFSENENKVIRDLIAANMDASCFFDYHMNGTSGNIGEYQNNFWHYVEYISGADGFEELNEISKRNIQKITRSSHKNYGIPSDSGFCGYVSYNSQYSTLAAYAYSQGIPGFTIECTKKIQGEEVVYSANLLKMCTEFIGNHILNCCRSFQ